MNWTAEDVVKKMQENKDLAGVNGCAPILASKVVTDRHIQAQIYKNRCAPETEADFASWFKDILEVYGWRWCHFRPARVMRHGVETWETPVSGNAKGLPDYHVWHCNGLYFWVELKSETGKISKAQLDCIDSLRRAGEIVFIWRPSERENIKKILESPQAGQAEKV